MGTRRIRSGRVVRYPEAFTAGLSSAVLEWLLIILLFVNAVFSYLVTKFARYCNLKIPCLLCSRLDHVLGNEKPGFYRDLICGAHKLEISSLVFCHLHEKLADVHGMCEGCLFSFAAEKGTNPETYKLLVGKLGIDHGYFVDKGPILEHSMLDPSRVKHCSCCNELWKTRPYTHRLPQKKSFGSEVSKFDFHLPGSVGPGVKLFDGLKKRRNLVGRGFDPLSHIGYSELKITSDSESEIPFTDDDDASAVIHETNNPKEVVARYVQLESHTNVSGISEVSTSDRLIDQASQGQCELAECHHVKSSVCPNSAGHGVEELNWQQLKQKPHSPAIMDPILLHDVPSSSSAAEVVVEASRESFDVMRSGDLVGTSNNEREVCMSEIALTPETVPGSGKEQAVEVSGEISDAVQTVDVEQISSNEGAEASKSEDVFTTTTTTVTDLRNDLMSNIPTSPSLLNVTDLGDTHKLTPENEGGHSSSIPTEQRTFKDSAKVNENSKLLISAIRGSDTPVNDTSPRVHGVHEELKVPDDSCSTGLTTLQKRILIERNESGFESLDGSISETEGESSVDYLRRQDEYDRKCISDLYKELDEERSASAIAANEAMAMITRLQEEKAALHMEALQYLRMMEEQAEYDVEALQKANDLLTEREKEIQDLEAELDYYRVKYPDEDDENIPESYDVNVANTRAEHSGLSCSVNNTYGANDNWFLKKSEDNNQSGKSYSMPSNNRLSFKDCLLSFEDERLYIYQCLKKLAKNLNLCNDNGFPMDMCNGVHLEMEEHILTDMGQEIIERNQMDEDGSSKKDLQLSRGGSPVQERSSPSSRDSRCVVQGNHYFGGPDASITSTAPDLVSIESEILDLNERLETLEADRDFLEHAINSLQHGNEGVNFIQEIAYHLRELRRIGIKRREKDVA